MMRVKEFCLSYKREAERGGIPERVARQWQVEAVDAPFEYYSVSSSYGKLNRVASVDNMAEIFVTGGGSILRNKLTIPGVAALISCEDASGHVFSFIEEF